MKKTILSFLILCLTLTIVQAQNEPVNPFAEFGYTPRIATLSKGKYVEFHDQDSIVQISYALFNTNTMKLVGFVKRDTNYSEATLEPEVISRWLSPDPLSAEFPSWSPYNYVENNPINLIDPTGLAPEGVHGDKETKKPAVLNFQSKTLTLAKDNLSLNAVENSILAKTEFRSLSQPVSRLADFVNSMGTNGAKAPNGLATGSATPVYPEAALLPLPRIGLLAKSANASRSSTVFRAVSKAEVDDIAKFGMRTQKGGYETTKLFAPTAREAAQFGKNNFGFDGLSNTIMKVKIPNSTLKKSLRFKADGMNAISVPANQLNKLKATPLNSSPIK
jgi:hypothetical protein